MARAGNLAVLPLALQTSKTWTLADEIEWLGRRCKFGWASEAPLKDPNHNIVTILAARSITVARKSLVRNLGPTIGARSIVSARDTRDAAGMDICCLRPALLVRLWSPGSTPAVRCHLPFNDLAPCGRLKVHARFTPLISLGLLLIADILFCELGLSHSLVNADTKNCDSTRNCCPMLQHRTS